MAKCSRYTAIKIKMDLARTKAKRNYFRRRLREHAMKCTACGVRKSNHGKT